MVIFENEQLVPASWAHLLRGGPVRIFNPGLLRRGDHWILAYRAVFEADGLRRIALCRLDERFVPIPPGASPYSDEISFRTNASYPDQALTWFADPRLYVIGGRTYIYWNSGWHEPRNYQFLQEFDPPTLRAISSARELTIAGGRQKLEKNWALFEHGEAAYAVYSVNPHRVLRVDLSGGGDIACHDLSPAIPNPGGFAQSYGGLRGGSPPQRVGEHFISFCHAIENAGDGYRYVAAAYEFSASAPFAPTRMPERPLRIDVPADARRRHPKLNPAVGEVVYPAGAAYHGAKWYVSVGIDDERCGIAILDEVEVRATLRPPPISP